MNEYWTLYWIAVSGSLISYMCLCALSLVNPTRGQLAGFVVVTFIPVMNAVFIIHCLSTLFQGIFFKKA